MSILNKKINKQLAAQYDLNYTDLRIDDLFLTKYDAAKVSDDNASSFESLSLCVGSFAGKWKASHLV
jgi:hypothetical protein